jgi:hypothetical protein
MPSDRIVEPLEAIEASAFASSLVRYIFVPILSIFREEKKLSIPTLSQTFPERLMEQMTHYPSSASETVRLDIGYLYPNDAVKRLVFHDARSL